MSIEEHSQSLRAEHNRVQVELGTIQARARALELELGRIEAAISALSGRKHRSPARNKNTRRGVTTNDVITRLVAHLEAGPCKRTELASAVQEGLKADGMLLTGFALRFRQALADQRFLEDGNDVRLR